MINISEFITKELGAVYPTYSENYIPQNAKFPCISYNIVTNNHLVVATNLIYSRIVVTLKIYSHEYIDDAKLDEIDNIMILNGFIRTSGQDIKIDPDINMYVANYEITLNERYPNN